MNQSPEETSSLEEDVAKASKQIAETRDGLHQPTPGQLFHYTTAAGFLGMLSSNRIWGSNYRFLNDKSEITYGGKILEQVVNARLDSQQEAIAVEFLSDLMKTSNAFEGMADCYVACFCERSDLLHQWRSYAAEGGGYAIGFATDEIGRRINQRNPAQEVNLNRVIYNRNSQTKLMSEVIDLAISMLVNHSKAEAQTNDKVSMFARLRRFVSAEVAIYLLTFKHPAFEIEAEWRLSLIQLANDDLDVRVREGLYGLTPYVELDPTPEAGNNHNKLPITRIIHGPVPDPANIRFALGALLRRSGYFRTGIDGSDLPLRLAS